MPFVNGVFQRVFNWVNDKNANIDITASRFDTEDDGFATGLSTAILKDGTQIITANIPMAAFKFTGLGAGSARTDSANLGQVQDSGLNWVVAAGTSDAITAGYSPALTVLIDGQLCFLRATAANTTTTPTFSPNGLTARTITKLGGAALAVADIAGALAEVILRYNLAATRWELLNPVGAIVAKTLQFTRAHNASNGTVGYTGFGFKPTAARIEATINGDATVVCIGNIGTDGVGACTRQNGASWSAAAAPYLISEDSDATSVQGNWVSWDADGLSIAFVKTGAPAAKTVQINITCYR